MPSLDLYPGFGLGAVEILRRLFYCTSISFLGVAAASFALKADPDLLPYDILYRVGGRSGHSTSVSPFDALDSKTVSLVERAHSNLRNSVRGKTDHTLTQTGLLARIRRGRRALLRRSTSGSDNRRCPDLWVALELVPELAQQGVATLLAWDDSSVMAQLVQTQTRLRHMVFIREDRLFPVERVKVRNLGGVLGIEFSNELLRRPNQLIKRSLDIVLGTTGLVIALPILRSAHR